MYEVIIEDARRKLQETPNADKRSLWLKVIVKCQLKLKGESYGKSNYENL